MKGFLKLWRSGPQRRAGGAVHATRECLLLGRSNWRYGVGIYFRREYLLLLPVYLMGDRVLSPPSYQPIDKLSTVQFSIKNLGFTVTGSFGGVAGKIDFDPAVPGNAAFDVTVDAGSVNTDNSMRDGHLRKESYFDTDHYPKIRLVSDKIAFHRNGAYLFNGKLTIKGHTAAIGFPFTAAQVNGGYRFRGTFSINRRDFEVGGSSTISDRVEINLDVIVK